MDDPAGSIWKDLEGFAAICDRSDAQKGILDGEGSF